MTVLVDARPLSDPLQGGVTRVALELVRALAAAMPQDRFIWATTGYRRRLSATNLPPNVEERHRSLPNKIVTAFTSAGILSFEDFFPRTHADVLFLPNIGCIGRPRLPYVLVVHDLSFLIEPGWFSLKGRLWHRLIHARRLIKEATHLLAVSERTKKDLIEHLSIAPEKITTIPLGLTLHVHSHPLPPVLEGRRFFLLPNVRDPRKNAACAIAAFQELIQEPAFADVLLVMTGVTRNTELGARNARYISLDHPSDRALAGLMQHASALLCPSWYEGFGLPLHEAAQFHTPCLASTAGALPETAPLGTILIPPAKPHLWLAAMRQVLIYPKNFQTQTSLSDWSVAGNSVAHVMRTHR